MSITSPALLGLLAGITQAVHAGGELDALLQDILERIAAAFDARGCTLRVLELPDGELRLRAATGLSPAYLAKGAVRAEGGLSEIFEAAPVVIADVAHDPRVQYPQEARREGIAAIIGLPFAILGEMRMVLRIYFDRPVTPDPDTLTLLDILAGQGALAIRQALLQQRYFVTFREISAAIHSGREVGEILQRIVAHITSIVGARGCIFWILNSAEGLIVNRVVEGFDYRSLSHVDYAGLCRIFDPASGRRVLIADARTDVRIPELERLGKKRIQTVLGLPFAIAPPYRGLLAVYFSRPRTLQASEIEFITALGEQGAIALHKALAYDESRLDLLRRTVEGLALALEAKDGQTHGHSLRVAGLARAVAEALGLAPAERDAVHQAGLLHDIGKIGLQDEVLARLGRLAPEEMEQLRQHPVLGARILAPVSLGEETVGMVRHHHEHFDGSGYPDGRQGSAIPLGARILGVCDALETMVYGRARLPRLPLAEALARLRQEAGRRFDPQVVEAVVGVVAASPGLLAPEAPAADAARSRGRGRLFGGLLPGRLTRKFPPSF